MFARTPRLLLRPGFPEDAPALAAAMSDKAIARNLAVVPWPYTLRDAEAFLASPRDPVLPSFLIFERTETAPRADRLVRPWDDGRQVRSRWAIGSPVRTGAAASRPKRVGALIDIARTLGLASLEGSHFIDNPASARVLDKLGFEAGGHHRSAHELRARRGSAGAADAAAAEAIGSSRKRMRRWRLRPPASPSASACGAGAALASYAREQRAVVLVPGMESRAGRISTTRRRSCGTCRARSTDTTAASPRR